MKNDHQHKLTKLAAGEYKYDYDENLGFRVQKQSLLIYNPAAVGNYHRQALWSVSDRLGMFPTLTEALKFLDHYIELQLAERLYAEEHPDYNQ